MQNSASTWNLETLLVHNGRRTSTIAGTPTIPPIYASTTYLHDSAEALDQAFSGTTSTGEQAFVYGRHGNPSTCALADVFAHIEGGVGAATFGSGMAAVHTALLAAGLVPGTKIVASRDLYGATVELLQKVFISIGVEVMLSDLCNGQGPDLIRAEQPDVVYVETLSNPLVKLIDLDAISAAARDVGAVSIVDSTFTTPYLVRPLEHGFDLVLHSTTKYIGGHGDSTGGILVSAKNTLLAQVYSYATMVGAMLSPFESHLIMRGLRTLPLRMERQCSNALRVAHFLQEHPAVSHVYYPGLPSHPQHALATQLLSHTSYGGLVAFDLKAQSREAAFRFMNNLRLCLPATTLGDVFSLVSYPPLSSHRNLTEAERRNAGITEGCIRLSVGIEYVEDIINDLDQALT